MEYYLGWGENSCFKIAIEFPSSLQTALLSACYDKLILKAKQVVCLGNLYLKKDLLFRSANWILISILICKCKISCS